MPPKATRIETIDNHYLNYDTQKHIDTYNKVAEFERAVKAIETYWHYMLVPNSEVLQVKPYLKDPNQTQNMISYLMRIKRFYALESKIMNLNDQRDAFIMDLSEVSHSFEIQEFTSQSVKLMLSIRKLTFSIVNALKQWESMV